MTILTELIEISTASKIEMAWKSALSEDRNDIDLTFDREFAFTYNYTIIVKNY